MSTKSVKECRIIEVDLILEFAGGEYAAVEIKLGYNQVEEAKKVYLPFIII